MRQPARAGESHLEKTEYRLAKKRQADLRPLPDLDRRRAGNDINLGGSSQERSHGFAGLTWKNETAVIRSPCGAIATTDGVILGSNGNRGC